MSTVAEPPKKLLTAEEFAALPEPSDGSKQELVRGEVVTVMSSPGFNHGIVQVNIATLLKVFTKQHRLGRVTTESGVRTEYDPDSVRGPDVGYWSYERVPPDQTPKPYPKVAADLCVEVRSPSNTQRKLTLKAREYLASGVRMVWIVDTEERTVTIYRQPDEGRVIAEDASISGEEVVPGFSCRVSEFFEDV